jgi:hypothetical protein
MVESLFCVEDIWAGSCHVGPSRRGLLSLLPPWLIKTHSHRVTTESCYWNEGALRVKWGVDHSCNDQQITKCSQFYENPFKNVTPSQ